MDCTNTSASYDIAHTSAIAQRALYCLLMLFVLAGCQNAFVYHPDRKLVADPAAVDLSFIEKSITTEDGVIINAWWIPAERPRFSVLFCHGNAGNISHRLDTIKILHGLGLGVLIFDYRGFGLSGGAPSEQGTYKDVYAVWKHMTGEMNIPQERIIIMGRSLGAAVAAWLASKARPAMLVLESGFYSMKEIARHYCSLCPTGIIITYKYETAVYAASARCPVMVIHSRDDEIIPFNHGRRIYEGLRGERFFNEIRGSHNGGFLTSRESYIYGLDRFIAKHER